MSNEAYEKVVTGKSLNRIFGENKRFNDVESYLIHVETVDGTENNYVEGSKYGRREVEGIYVSKENLTSLKME